MGTRNSSVNHILQIIFFCVPQKIISDDRSFVFGWTIPCSQVIQHINIQTFNNT